MDSNSLLEKKKSIEYEFEILESIRDNPGGVTITDIANDKGFSRNTVSKYVSILELKKQIYRKKIGAYNLFFSSKTSFLPKSIIMSYYKAMLIGLKNNFPNKEEIFKKIGREAVKHIKFNFGSKVLKQLRALSGHRILQMHLEMFKSYYSSYDILQPNIEISEFKIDPNGKNAIFRFKNSEFLKDSDDFIYHIYLSCGILEGVLLRELKTPVICNIDKINISNNNIEESYFDISIKIE